MGADQFLILFPTLGFTQSKFSRYATTRISLYETLTTKHVKEERGNRSGSRGDTGICFTAVPSLLREVHLRWRGGRFYDHHATIGLTLFSDGSRHERPDPPSPLLDPFEAGTGAFYNTIGEHTHNQIGGSQDDNKLPQEQGLSI